MLSHQCAFCGVVTHFTAIAGLPTEKLDTEGNGLYAYAVSIAATCDHCRKINVASGIKDGLSRAVPVGSHVDVSTAKSWGETMKGITWSPPSMVQAGTEFLPPNVAAFLQEAHDVFSVGAYRAVLLLVRSVVEATAKDCGVMKGTLEQKIDALQEKQRIRTGTQEMAHALRILGNDMAHGDITDEPTEEDASDALTIARFVLDDVYVANARVADMLARRNK